LVSAPSIIRRHFANQCIRSRAGQRANEEELILPTEAPRPTPDPLVPLHDALRSRYDVERELGRGGMGERLSLHRDNYDHFASFAPDF
jgi:hypothetical protein